MSNPLRDFLLGINAIGVPLPQFLKSYNRSLTPLQIDLARRRSSALAGNPRTRPALGAAVTVGNTSTEPNINVWQRTPNAPANATDWDPYCRFEGGWPILTSTRVNIYAATKTDPTSTGGTVPPGTADAYQVVGVMRTVFTGQVARFNLNATATGQRAFFLVGNTFDTLQFVDKTNGTALNSGDNFISLDMGTRGVYAIEVRVSGGAVTSGGSENNVVGFGRLYPLKTDTFRAPPYRPQLAIYGDSYTRGQFISTTNGITFTNYDAGYARVAGDYLGVGVQASAVGGTGYLLRSNTNNLPSLVDRYQDMFYANMAAGVAYKGPDMAATAMGINDAPAIGTTFTQAQLDAAIAFVAAQAAVRGAGKPTVMFGPWMGATGQTNIPLVQSLMQGQVAALANNRVSARATYDTTQQNAVQWGIGNTTAPFSGNLTFTAALSGATSGTLSTPFIGTTSSSYILYFSDGTPKVGVTLTNGSTAVNWSGAVTATAAVYYTHASSAGTNDVDILADKTHLNAFPGYDRIGQWFAQQYFEAIMGMT